MLFPPLYIMIVTCWMPYKFSNFWVDWDLTDKEPRITRKKNNTRCNVCCCSSAEMEKKSYKCKHFWSIVLPYEYNLLPHWNMDQLFRIFKVCPTSKRSRTISSIQIQENPIYRIHPFQSLRRYTSPIIDDDLSKFIIMNPLTSFWLSDVNSKQSFKMTIEY